MEPKVLSKRCFKNFSEQSFLQDLKQGLSKTSNFNDFNDKFKNTLNDHAPIKLQKSVEIQNHMSTRFLGKT